MSDSIIKIKHLTKIYKLYDDPVDRLKESLHWRGKKYHKDFYALNDISFEIKRGETVGIIGKNGSGKSTLLKLITGVLTPTSGKVIVNGKVSALLELGAGFNPEYTGIENIYFQGSLMGYTREEINAKVDSILAFADIGEFIYQPVKIYSSGMFARLAFAVAINVEPDILIVDEALSVGDALFQIKCHKKMQALRENGTTVLFVSHDTYTIRTICSKAILLNNGNMLFYSDSKYVINEYLKLLNLSQEKEDISVENIIVNDFNHPDFKIKSATIYDNYDKLINEVSCNQEVRLEFTYDYVGKSDCEVCFVFNIYRKYDNLYICGATSLMDLKKTTIIKNGVGKIVSISIPSLNLLSGIYQIRFAINDKSGIAILCEANDALTFNIVDKHEAEGLITLNRVWNIIEI